MNFKKILFVCGSLEPGQDGVGDYTRVLAGELISRGLDCCIISLKDRSAENILTQNQSTRGHNVSVVRLSQMLSVRRREKEYKKLLRDYSPHWVSVQYVPYAFSAKGIPLYLPGFLKSGQHDIKWHLMIHEAYIGKKPTIKEKLIRGIQILILKDLVKKLKPAIVHTSILSYRAQLSQIGIESQILGLFGNIPLAANTRKSTATDTLIGIYFGAAPKIENFENFTRGIRSETAVISQKVEIIFCGKSGKNGRAFVNKLRENVNTDKLRIIEKGKMAEADLSELFLRSDFGIARVSPELLGKSGSAISMLEHGLPLWVPVAKDESEIANRFDYRTGQCYFSIEKIARKEKSFVPGSRLTEIADSFEKSLANNIAKRTNQNV